MAGVRKLRSGTWQGWFKNRQGSRQFFTLSKAATRRDTLQAAHELEIHHTKAALGIAPPVDPSREARMRSIADVITEYLQWGAFQGGRKGRPWSALHHRQRTQHLTWWRARLALTTLGDCQGLLPRVEQALQALAATGYAGKTLAHYRETLGAFCDWCVTRHYLAEHPLKGMAAIDTTPQSRRRALTGADVRRLLAACPPHRALLYETAFLTGLRAKELRHLTTDHLDLDQCGLRLDAAWTKNQLPGFQPLPQALMGRLARFAVSGHAVRLYARAYGHKRPRSRYPDAPLLVVPQNTAVMLYGDLQKAGIPRQTHEGKVDFHALRVAYTTGLFEVGATVPEARELARHQDPELTLGTYARTRAAHLRQRVEDLAATIEDPLRAPAVHAHAVGVDMPQEAAAHLVPDTKGRTRERLRHQTQHSLA